MIKPDGRLTHELSSDDHPPRDACGVFGVWTHDEDVAKLAEKSRQAQKDFAAGHLSDRDLLWIILIIVAVLIIALAVR